jgi:DnaJ-class molecular chaperone
VSESEKGPGCGDCEGTGVAWTTWGVTPKRPCPFCNGTGKEPSKQP